MLRFSLALEPDSPEAIRVLLKLHDARGKVIAQSAEVVINPGEFGSIDFDGEDLLLRANAGQAACKRELLFSSGALPTRTWVPLRSRPLITAPARRRLLKLWSFATKTLAIAQSDGNNGTRIGFKLL